MEFNSLYIPQVFTGQIMQKWEQLHDTAKPVAFAYRLNIVRCRYLRGNLNFYTEVSLKILILLSLTVLSVKLTNFYTT